MTKQLAEALPDGPFAIITMLGDPIVVLIAVGALVYAAPRVGFITPKSARRVGVSVVLTLGVVWILKHLFAVPRPSFATVPVDGFSFPSGHTAGAVALFVGVAVVARKLPMWINVGLVGIAALVGLSRVALGVHYIGDVVIGGLIGILVVYWRLRPEY